MKGGSLGPPIIDFFLSVVAGISCASPGCKSSYTQPIPDDVEEFSKLKKMDLFLTVMRIKGK